MTDLDARYGLRPAASRTALVWVSAVVLVVAGLVWLVWAKPWEAHEFWETTGYRIIDERSAEVTWVVTLADGETASCAAAVQNSASAIVGWKQVEVTGGALPSQQLTALVRTTELGATGFAYRCWLT